MTQRYAIPIRNTCMLYASNPDEWCRNDRFRNLSVQLGPIRVVTPLSGNFRSNSCVTPYTLSAH